jgi:histo-blood group ABO system transferase
MKTISLLIVATNKYVTFLPNLLESVEKYFCKSSNVELHIFTDRVNDVGLISNQIDLKILIHEVEHKPWPFATLYRFHFFKKYIPEINGHYVFYIDADTQIFAPIFAEDIISPSTLVKHCGFVNGGGSWETRKESRAYTSPSICKTYYGGGFWGFDRANFKLITDLAVDMIDEDVENEIIPIWHDESVLNAIIAYLPPLKELTPSYHYPQNNKRICDSWKERYECKILLLDKKHKEFQK